MEDNQNTPDPALDAGRDQSAIITEGHITNTHIDETAGSNNNQDYQNDDLEETDPGIYED